MKRIITVIAALMLLLGAAALANADRDAQISATNTELGYSIDSLAE